MTYPVVPPPFRLRPHHALALLPAVGILGGVPIANHVHRYVFGLPFLLAWIVGCVILTSAVMAAIGALDRAAARRAAREAGRRETAAPGNA